MDKRVQSASLLDAVPSESGLREAKAESDGDFRFSSKKVWAKIEFRP